jgi:hypothetical protein
MKSNRAVLTALVLVVVLVAGWWLFHRGSSAKVDLLDQFQQAKQAGGTYSVVSATLAGDSKKAILAPPNGRLTFHVKVPDDGWLRVSLGTQPETWDKDGNGVLFFAGVSDGRSFEKLFEQVLNPHANPSERRWIPVAVDLSAYAGEEMDIILNTRSSAAGVAADERNDQPLWGAPAISR